jgi:hypothetical protein
MKKRMGLVVVLLAAIVVAGGTIVATQGRAQPEGPIYSELQVVKGLTSHPQLWVGRTIRVRGISSDLICSGTCSDSPGPPQLEAILRGEWLPTLRDTSNTEGPGPSDLPILLKPRSSLVEMFSRIPGLGSLLPGRTVAWKTPAVYQLRIQARPCIMGIDYCYEGVLTDAIPTVP